MTHAARCAECHADIPSDTPDGHCPSCLFALGLASRAEGASPETLDLAAILARSHAPLGVKFHRLGDSTAKFWDVTRRTEVATLTGHGDEVWTIALSPDGATAVTGSSDHTIRWWAVPSGRLLAVLAGHKEGVFRAAFSPDGRTLATASDDDTVRLWHLATRREVARLDHGFNVVGVSFTPDGETLVSSSPRNAVHLFRAPSFSALDEAERKKLVQE